VNILHVFGWSVPERIDPVPEPIVFAFSVAAQRDLFEIRRKFAEECIRIDRCFLNEEGFEAVCVSHSLKVRKCLAIPNGYRPQIGAPIQIQILELHLVLDSKVQSWGTAPSQLYSCPEREELPDA